MKVFSGGCDHKAMCWDLNTGQSMQVAQVRFNSTTLFAQVLIFPPPQLARCTNKDCEVCCTSFRSASVHRWLGQDFKSTQAHKML